jgi:F0F1-type ATP synthase assembly protein I
MLVACTLVGTGLGFVADRRLGTEPWLMIGGVLLGLAAGLLYVVDKAWTRQGPRS